MKKSNFIRLALISLALLSCLLLAACNGDQPVNQGPLVDSIAIASNAKPQTVFAQGQDLDLSKGSLTVVFDNGRKETVALNAEGVTVTGYDKEKLGDQTLMITYGGKSISLTVNVAKRMTFSGYEKDYFVGDELDLSKGKVSIVKNDGTIASVRLNDPSISVVSFDGSTAGQGKLATIRYSADGAEYTDTIAVNVYEIGSVKFVKPTKSIYGSHNTELNLEGGYITITAKDNEDLKKPITLTQDMISGFDPTAATRDHVSEALIQTITVAYGGQSYTFDIRLFYSGVSIMQDAIDALKDLDLNAEEIIVGFDEGEIAMEAVKAYMDLTPTDRNLLVHGDVNRVARICAIYAGGRANDLGVAVKEAVIFQNGMVSLNNEATYEAVENAIAVLSDPECELRQFHGFLRDFVDVFGNVYVVGQLTIAEHVGALDDLMFDSVVDGLTFMLQIYNDLLPIPEEWEPIDLIGNQKSLNAAVDHIMNFNNPSMVGAICTIASSWRTNNDLIEIIYAYYYYYFRGMMMDEIGYVLPFPGPLQELYMLISTTASLGAQVEAAGQAALWQDMTSFYYYYTLCLEKIDEIMNQEEYLYIGLYNFLEFDDMFKGYVLYPNVGVINLMGSLYGDDQAMALMDDYMALVKKTMTGPEPVLNFEENKDHFQRIIDGFIAMSPAKQKHFLSAMFYLYGSEEVRDTMVLTLPEEHERGIFLFLMNSYFTEYMSETTMPMVQDMLLAIEYYLNRDSYEDSMGNFNTKMEALSDSYAKLSAEDKALFDSCMGGAYAKYSLLYRLEKNGATIDQELYTAQFDELVQVFREFEMLLNSLSDPETNQLNSDALGTALAAYSRAKILAEAILDHENPEVVALFSVLDMNWDEEHKFDMDYLYMVNRLFFLRVLHDIRFTQIKEDGTEKLVYGWEVYTDADVDKLMYDAYYVMIQAYNNAEEYDQEKVMAAMKTFRDTVVEEARAIYIFDVLGSSGTYYKGLEAFFAQVISDGNKEFAAKLLEAEQAYIAYLNNQKSGVKLVELMVVMGELMELRKSVADMDNYNTYLAEMYDFYIEQYNNINFDDSDLGFGTEI